ncbi:SDR family oxidoreductase [Plantactinospora sp. WMMB334]|uniref:SDR family oxidoreductase n=1 Tax=Plantactinospora sp. WMMB334 TaxID=3404119 RepID=UPI003B961FD1
MTGRTVPPPTSADVRPRERAGPAGGAGGRIRYALVTGASGDIGRAVLRRLAGDGARIVAHCHRGDLDPDVEVDRLVRADLLAPGGAGTLLDALPADWPGLDLLVNCVGGARPRAFVDLDEDEWEACLAVNVTVPFRTIRAAVGPLSRVGGAVVNLSSVAALTGGAFGPHYAAAKAALIGLTRSAARELGRLGIRVNVVAPGPVDSRMTASLTGAQLTALLDATALGRVVRPEEIADTVAWLAGAPAITGQTVVVDGGRCFV